MKKINRLVSLIVFLPAVYLAQFNLVPNPSFENYSNCPSSSNQLNYATGWQNPCSNGSPDYYNSCSSIPGVPNCGGPCFQYAKDGNAYAGIYGYDGITLGVREYLRIKLKSPLINGKCYYVGFYANEANWCGLASNNLGVYLSNLPVTCFGLQYILNYSPQILSFDNKIIQDTLNWTFVGGIFQSNNNEEYITIGNFTTNNLTDTLMFNPNAQAPKYAYYFIDSVFVTPVDSMPTNMSAFAGNDITIYPGDSTFIGQEISNLNCNWYQGTTLIASNISGLYVKPTITTTYIIEQSLCGYNTSDTVVVNVNSSTNINELILKNDEVIISPNPSNGILSIQISNKKFSIQKSEIKLLNLFGKEVNSFILTSIDEKIEIQNLEKGIYYIQLQKNNKIIVTKKIVIL